MPFSQMHMWLAVLLLAALLDRATCSSTIIKVPPIKPGEMNQTIVVNIPPTVDVQRSVQRGNDTSAKLILQPQPLQSPGVDCLLSDCDENDVGCDGLPPCGPFCPPEACSRVNCSQCWQAGFSGPCCRSCCSQYMPYTYSQQPLALPQQSQQPFYAYPQPEAIPLPQAQPISFPQLRPIPISQPQAIPIPQQQGIPIPQPQVIPIPQPQAIPISQQQAFPIPQPQVIPFPLQQSIPIPQPQPIPIPQLQPIPIPQPQPYPVPQPQPIPIPQPQPMPFPISVPQPYAVPQPIPYPQYQPQVQPQPMPQQIMPPQASSYYMPSQCRQIPWWPFMRCPQTPSCRQWYQPGCAQQATWPNLCYSAGSC